MRLYFRLLIICLSLLLLSSCASNQKEILAYAPRNVDMTNLNDIKALHQVKIKVDKDTATTSIRTDAIKETAMTLASQGALALRSEEIDAMLTKNTHYLDKAFNFNAMLLYHEVLPPVLTESSNSLNQSDDDTIRISDKTYKIVQQARFVTAPPHWREYVWMNFKEPEVPDPTLLPKNDMERAEWQRFAEEGWKQGVQQANNIFAANVARMQRDYNGMALYKKLLDQHMISQPFVAKTRLGITGDANTLNINDKVYRITSKPELNPDSKTWLPAIADPNKNTHF